MIDECELEWLEPEHDFGEKCKKGKAFQENNKVFHGHVAVLMGSFKFTSTLPVCLTPCQCATLF